MSLFAKDLSFSAQLLLLLPGFVTACIFYTLTAHPRLSEFERVVQALLFTLCIRVILFLSHFILISMGRFVGTLGSWSPEGELVGSFILACFLGLLFTWNANEDFLHSLLREKNWTTRTSYPSEWYSSFYRHRKCVVLHLSDDRRLFGWAEEWPNNPVKGHFLIEQPSWLLDSGVVIPLHQTSRFLISARRVEMVEFVQEPEDIAATSEEVEKTKFDLVNLNLEAQNGSQSSTTGTE